VNNCDYVIRVFDSPLQIDAQTWNALLAQQAQATPFMRHEYLAALHTSQSACQKTGWTPCFITLWSQARPTELMAACAVYLKAHSYGEYVFDWAWANAYAQHGLAYYPKALVAVPFTPVPGTRLLAVDDSCRQALVRELLAWCQAQQLSSLHLLFASEADLAACSAAGLMLRQTVQFHWKNEKPAALATDSESARPFYDFEDFLASLSQEKRKKIRQERRKVFEAGVSFRWVLGSDITPADWHFFYQCYERTYLEHGNAPYLSQGFFSQMTERMPENWLLFVAMRHDKPIASSLIALNQAPAKEFPNSPAQAAMGVAYGRYWGALERVDCLHFEACYYQPLQWCIAHGFARFEGGAQGEHKMARALMPVKTSSAHWLSHPAFASAVGNFLEREGQGIDHYLQDLSKRTPFRHPE
jgi:uncharacterized protein